MKIIELTESEHDILQQALDLYKASLRPTAHAFMRRGNKDAAGDLFAASNQADAMQDTLADGFKG